MAKQPTPPPKRTPFRNKGFIRPYCGKPILISRLNKAKRTSKKTSPQLIQPFWKKIPLIPPARFSRFQLMRYISQTQGDTDSMATTVPNLGLSGGENFRWNRPFIFPAGGWGKGQLLIGGGHCNRIKPSEMKKNRSTEGEINRPRIFFQKMASGKLQMVF